MKKKKATKLTGKAKKLPGKDTDTGLISEALTEASKFTKTKKNE